MSPRKSSYPALNAIDAPVLDAEAFDAEPLSNGPLSNGFDPGRAERFPPDFYDFEDDFGEDDTAQYRTPVSSVPAVANEIGHVVEAAPGVTEYLFDAASNSLGEALAAHTYNGASLGSAPDHSSPTNSVPLGSSPTSSAWGDFLSARRESTVSSAFGRLGIPLNDLEDATEEELRQHLSTLRQERDDALARLDQERTQLEERVTALTGEQDRFVSRMLLEHEEELFLRARETRRFREELKTTQQELAAARRDSARVQAELEAVRSDLKAAQAELAVSQGRAVHSTFRSQLKPPQQSYPRMKEPMQRVEDLDQLLSDYALEIGSTTHAEESASTSSRRTGPITRDPGETTNKKKLGSR